MLSSLIPLAMYLTCGISTPKKKGAPKSAPKLRPRRPLLAADRVTLDDCGHVAGSQRGCRSRHSERHHHWILELDGLERAHLAASSREECACSGKVIVIRRWAIA